jgi:hypothetical protein
VPPGKLDPAGDKQLNVFLLPSSGVQKIAAGKTGHYPSKMQIISVLYFLYFIKKITHHIYFNHKIDSHLFFNYTVNKKSSQ